MNLKNLGLKEIRFRLDSVKLVQFRVPLSECLIEHGLDRITRNKKRIKYHMMRITIISIGKLKESYWKEAEAEYLKRLSAFAKVEIIEHKEIGFSEKDTVESIKENEVEIILNSIPASSYMIALDPHGKELSSESLSKNISDLEHTTSHLTFIIGGPLGLHESIFKKTNLKLSLSPLTFTHQMTRVILLEQIYRAYMIKSGKSYHH